MESCCVGVATKMPAVKVKVPGKRQSHAPKQKMNFCSQPVRKRKRGILGMSDTAVGEVESLVSIAVMAGFR